MMRSVRSIAFLLLAVPTAASQEFPSRAPEAKAQQEKAEKAEAQKAREKQEEISRKEREKAGTPARVATDAEARTVAEKAAHFEKVYRERAARIDRLIDVYRKKGDAAKVAELQGMREQLTKRHTNAMQGFRAQLGEERWTKVEKHWGGPSARALEVRNPHANENAAEREARKAQKEAEGKDKDKDKDKEKEKEKHEKPNPPPQRKPN